MTQPLVNFDENENIEDICQHLNTVHFRKAPVTKDNKLRDIITIHDINRYILYVDCQEINL